MGELDFPGVSDIIARHLDTLRDRGGVAAMTQAESDRYLLVVHMQRAMVTIRSLEMRLDNAQRVAVALTDRLVPGITKQGAQRGSQHE